MIVHQIELNGNKDDINIGLTPVMLVVRDTNGKNIYELNDIKLIEGKLFLESHYFIKRDGSIMKIRDENMETELDKPIFNKYILLVDIEGDFNIEEMDHVRGNSLITLVKDIQKRFPYINKIVPYFDIYPKSNTPGSNFPTTYLNLLLKDDETYYKKIDKKSASTNPYINSEKIVYKTRKLFISYPYLKGNDVSTLKFKLAELGFEVDVNTDVYDESLATIINLLRQKLGLPQNGIATIDLMEEIDNMVNSVNTKNITSKTVQFNRIIEIKTPYMSGNDIEQIQSILFANNYYNGEINSTYDVATENAIIKFQKDKMLTEDGIVTLNVWRKLNELPIAKFERLIYLTEPNMSGYDITAIQKRLFNLGYTSIEITGVYDINTENIVKQFQFNNSLKSDGKITQTVFNKIFK